MSKKKLITGEYTSLYNAIETGLKQEKRPCEHFYVGDLGKCFRMRILKRLNLPSYPPDNRALRVFKMGNLVEDLVIEVLKKNNVLISAQEKLYFLEFSGRPDAIIRVIDGDAVLECKSVNSKAFHYMKGEEPPHTSYIYQAIWYAWIKGYKRAYLTYVSKDDLCIKEFHLPVDRYKQAMVKDMLKTMYYWRNKIFPKALEEADWQCRYCPYFEGKKPKDQESNWKACSECKTVKDFKENITNKIKEE